MSPPGINKLRSSSSAPSIVERPLAAGEMQIVCAALRYRDVGSSIVMNSPVCPHDPSRATTGQLEKMKVISAVRDDHGCKHLTIACPTCVLDDSVKPPRNLQIVSCRGSQFRCAD